MGIIKLYYIAHSHCKLLCRMVKLHTSIHKFKDGLYSSCLHRNHKCIRDKIRAFKTATQILNTRLFHVWSKGNFTGQKLFFSPKFFSPNLHIFPALKMHILLLFCQNGYPTRSLFPTLKLKHLFHTWLVAITVILIWWKVIN